MVLQLPILLLVVVSCVRVVIMLVVYCSIALLLVESSLTASTPFFPRALYNFASFGGGCAVHGA